MLWKELKQTGEDLQKQLGIRPPLTHNIKCNDRKLREWIADASELISPGDVFNELLGGMGVQGAADNLMVLSDTPDGDRVLAIRGKDIDDSDLLFTVEDEGATWSCEGAVGEVQRTVQRQSLYDYLDVKGPTSFTDIEQAARDGSINIAVSSVKVIIRKMVKDGQLEQDQRRGKYAVAGYQQRHVDLGVSERMKRRK